MSGGRPGESQRYFYPRSPCGERLPDVSIFNLGGQFLSTLSLRRATKPLQQSKPPARFLSTLSLRRATAFLIFLPIREALFLSTLSLRRATHYDNYNLHCVEISIHALLAESDEYWVGGYGTSNNFYPRSPCGERPIFAVRPYDAPIFLSTLSLRRATGQGRSSCAP